MFPVFVGLNVILADTLRHRSFELLVRKRCCGPNDVPFARGTKDALARWFALEFFLSQLTPVKYWDMLYADTGGDACSDT